MKNLFGLLLICALLLFSRACTRAALESPLSKPCVAHFPGENVTYEGYVKGIMSTYCTRSCHVGDASAPGDFRTYQGIQPYIGGFVSHVIGDGADMPLGDAPLPQSIRDSLNIWIRNCAP
jgi:hypothetical protein